MTERKKWYCPHIESFIPPCAESCKTRCIPTCILNFVSDEIKEEIKEEIKKYILDMNYPSRSANE